jgi:hypothetical protein
MGFLASFLVCAHLAVNFYLILSISVKKFVFSAKVFFIKRKIAKINQAKVGNSSKANLEISNQTLNKSKLRKPLIAATQQSSLVELV